MGEWRNINVNQNDQRAFHSIHSPPDPHRMCEMDLIRGLFPEPVANEYNFVLFSTSGIHGSYTTIEGAERMLTTGRCGDTDTCDTCDCSRVPTLTFLIIHPRVVAMRFGNVYVRTLDDVQYLKKLRQSSHEVIAKIGMAGHAVVAEKNSNQFSD